MAPSDAQLDQEQNQPSPDEFAQDTARRKADQNNATGKGGKKSSAKGSIKGAVEGGVEELEKQAKRQLFRTIVLPVIVALLPIIGKILLILLVVFVSVAAACELPEIDFISDITVGVCVSDIGTSSNTQTGNGGDDGDNGDQPTGGGSNRNRVVRSTVNPGLTMSQAIIPDQQSDATPALLQLISDLDGEATRNNISVTITSISDDDLFPPGWRSGIPTGTPRCTPWDPGESFRDDSNCVHTNTPNLSAHYGGTLNPVTKTNDPRGHSTGFSCAVDLVSSNYVVLDNILDTMTVQFKQCEVRQGRLTSGPCSSPNVHHMHVRVPGCG